MMRKVLELEFLDMTNKTFKVRIDDPRDDLDEIDIEAAMDTILESSIFNSNNTDLVRNKGARIIETTVSVVEF